MWVIERRLMMTIIVQTSSPTPSARFYYLTQSRSGAYGWTPRLGEATRFPHKPLAQQALESVKGECDAKTYGDARLLRVGEG